MEENKPLPTSQNKVTTIHTYSSDMADAVRENDASVIKIALAEQKRREQEVVYQKAEGTKTSKVFLFISGLIIMALGIGGVYYVMQKKKTENTPPPITIQKTRTLISYDEDTSINMSTATNVNDAVGMITTEVKKGGATGKIKALFLTHVVDGKTESLPLENFLSLLKITAPSSLIRSLDEPYMVGMYQSINPNKAPHLFLIFQTKDFNQSYAGMLAWEKTLLDDFFGLFQVDVSGPRTVLFEKPWKDIVVANKDARILYDAVGNDVLYYIFVNKDFFIITDSQDTIQEISTRLLTQVAQPL